MTTQIVKQHKRITEDMKFEIGYSANGTYEFRSFFSFVKLLMDSEHHIYVKNIYNRTQRKRWFDKMRDDCSDSSCTPLWKRDTGRKQSLLRDWEKGTKYACDAGSVRGNNNLFQAISILAMPYWQILTTAATVMVVWLCACVSSGRRLMFESVNCTKCSSTIWCCLFSVFQLCNTNVLPALRRWSPWCLPALYSAVCTSSLRHMYKNNNSHAPKATPQMDLKGSAARNQTRVTRELMIKRVSLPHPPTPCTTAKTTTSHQTPQKNAVFFR